MKSPSGGVLRWLIASVLCSVATMVLISPSSWGITKRYSITNPRPVSGYQYRAEAPAFFTVEPARWFSCLSDRNYILEDGVRMGPDTDRDNISTTGHGLYAFADGGRVFFSSSDNTEPRLNGRRYEIVTSGVHVSDPLILLLMAGAIFCLYRLGGIPEFQAILTSDGLIAKGMSAGSLMVVGWMIYLLLQQPVQFAEGFFHSLWLPVLWSCAVGVLAPSRLIVLRITSYAALLLPVAASYVHYALGHASYPSFLIGGIIPWCDARAHFVQAAEMIRDGSTIFPMNGRFLFPAYFSSILSIAGLRMDLAHLMVGILFFSVLALSLKALVQWVGSVGCALFILIIWIYFRDRCSWLVMTENLGVTFGLLALPWMLFMVRLRSMLMLLVSILLMSMGFSARPGALFVLPMMVLFSGWCGWRGWCLNWVRPYFRVAAALVMAATVVFVGLTSNNLLQSFVFRGSVIPFGNFAFTLNGLLTRSNWSRSYTESKANVPEVMHQDLEIIRSHPAALFQGIGRAYSHAWKRRFLFDFSSEGRLAGVLWLLVILGLVALWRNKQLRDEALWISLILLGILLSIPFAPPWDASERPYAVTIPFQAFLAALGASVLASYCSRPPPFLRISTIVHLRSITPVAVASLIVIGLSVPLPILHALIVRQSHPETFSNNLPGRYLIGSSLSLDRYTYGSYKDGMRLFAALDPAGASPFLQARTGSFLGINWDDLECYAFLPGVCEVKDVRGVKMDVRLIGK